MKFRIGALALDRASIENLVAGLEQRHLGSDGIDDSGGVVAQDLGFALGRGGALADLVIDRIGGNRLHGDTDVAAFRFRFGGLEIDQRVRVVNSKCLFVSYSFHALSPICSCRLTVALAPKWQVL